MNKIKEIQWYKSKGDVYFARFIHLIIGLSALYFASNECIYRTNLMQVMFIIVGILCLGLSIVAGRWSYKENKVN